MQNASTLTLERFTLNAMENSFGTRLEQAAAAKATSKVALAKAVGVTPSAVSQWISGAIKAPSPENLFALADHLQCHARWLATGEGPQWLSEPERPAEPARRPALNAHDAEMVALYNAAPDSLKLMIELSLNVVRSELRRNSATRDATQDDSSASADP